MAFSYDPDDRLLGADPKVLGQRVPLPLHERVEELCDRVYDAKYDRPTKVKMLAALILSAPADVKALNTILRRYEAATVADALVTRRAEAGSIEFPERKSGPRG